MYSRTARNYPGNRNSDNGAYNIYRVVLEFSYYHTSSVTGRTTHHHGEACVNVKASSPTAAREFLLSHPYESYLPRYEGATVVRAYKLKRQPVWLRKTGKRGARFDTRSLWLGHIEMRPFRDGEAVRLREYARFNYRPTK